MRLPPFTDNGLFFFYSLFFIYYFSIQVHCEGTCLHWDTLKCQTWCHYCCLVELAILAKHCKSLSLWPWTDFFQWLELVASTTTVTVRVSRQLPLVISQSRLWNSLLIKLYCYKVSCISAYWSRYTYHKASAVPERASAILLSWHQDWAVDFYQKVRCNLGVRAVLQCA